MLLVSNSWGDKRLKCSLLRNESGHRRSLEKTLDFGLWSRPRKASRVGVPLTHVKLRAEPEAFSRPLTSPNYYIGGCRTLSVGEAADFREKVIDVTIFLMRHKSWLLLSDQGVNPVL